MDADTGTHMCLSSIAFRQSRSIMRMAFTKSSPVCGQREWAILTFKDAEVTGDFNTLIVKSEQRTQSGGQVKL